MRMRNNGTRVGTTEGAGKNKAASVTETGPAAGTVEITGNGHVFVQHLLIDRRAVAEYLQRAEPVGWPRLLVEALEIGVHCLEHASQAHGLDFMRQQAQEVAGEMARLPAQMEAEFRKQVGAKDGVLAPIVGAVGATEKLLKEKIAAVQALLDKEIDPRRADTTLGRTLGTITAMLDGKRDDSIQKTLDKAVQSVTSEDGRVAAVVKKTLGEALKPLREEIDRLRKEIQRQEVAEETLAATTAKGATFENAVLASIRSWAKFCGAGVEHVGGDHQPGDIVVRATDRSLGADEFVMVVEAKDDKTARGHKRLADEIGRAMKARNAHYGLYIARTEAGLAREIGDWAEGRCAQGPYVACTAANLLTALRFAVVDNRLRVLQSAKPQTDFAGIQREVRRVRAAIRRISTIRRRAGEIHKGADSVDEEAGELHREISDALTSIETALRSVASQAA